MRLLTHNLLSSHVRGVGPRGFPLRLQATEVRINPVEFNPNFVACMTLKVEWEVLLEAANSLHLIKVPKETIQGYKHDRKFLRNRHHILLEVDGWRGSCNAQSQDVYSPSAMGSPTCWLLSGEESMLVSQSCLTLCDPLDSNLPSSSVHGIL